MRHFGSEDELGDPTEAVCLDAPLRALPVELQCLIGKVHIPSDGGNTLSDAILNGEQVYGISDGLEVSKAPWGPNGHYGQRTCGWVSPYCFPCRNAGAGGNFYSFVTFGGCEGDPQS